MDKKIGRSKKEGKEKHGKRRRERRECKKEREGVKGNYSRWDTPKERRRVE